MLHTFKAMQLEKQLLREVGCKKIYHSGKQKEWAEKIIKKLTFVEVISIPAVVFIEESDESSVANDWSILILVFH